MRTFFYPWALKCGLGQSGGKWATLKKILVLARSRVKNGGDDVTKPKAQKQSTDHNKYP